MPGGIALTLSGGVDSTLLLSVFREVFPDLKITCITASFSEKDDEMDAARDMAGNLDCDFEPIIFGNFLQNLPLQVSIVGEPKWHYYGAMLAEKAARHAPVMVSGDGADELFGGYVFRYRKFLELVTDQTAWRDRAIAYMNCHNRDWVEDQERMFGPAIKFDWDMIYAGLRGHFENRLAPLEQVFLADYNGKLMHDWIPSWRSIHAYYGIAGFHPFLSDELIRLAQRIPPEQKYDARTGMGKLLLRSIHRGRGTSPAPYKRGFGPDLPEFWDRYGREIAGTYLADSRIARNGLIRQEWIASALDRANNGSVRYVNKLLSVLSLEIWYGLFVTGDVGPQDKLL